MYRDFQVKHNFRRCSKQNRSDTWVRFLQPHILPDSRHNSFRSRMDEKLQSGFGSCRYKPFCIYRNSPASTRHSRKALKPNCGYDSCRHKLSYILFRKGRHNIPYSRIALRRPRPDICRIRICLRSFPRPRSAPPCSLPDQARIYSPNRKPDYRDKPRQPSAPNYSSVWYIPRSCIAGRCQLYNPHHLYQSRHRRSFRRRGNRRRRSLKALSVCSN